MLRSIQSVSQPRSGHGLLTTCLLQYFGKHFDISEFRVERGFYVAGKYAWCEYYNHCQNSPCTDKRTTLSKSHDFELNLPNIEGNYYLIQYRDIIPSIISHYILNVRNNLLEDSLQSWELFLNDKIKYYESFYNKWIINNHNINTLYLKYENFIDNPTFHLTKTIEYLSPGITIDKNWLNEIILYNNIKSRSDIRTFKYYSEETYRAHIKAVNTCKQNT